MKIRITNGTFGHRVGDRVIAITAKDGPITVANEVGERLVKAGFAKVVETAKNEPIPVVEEKELFPEYNEKMTRGELENVALSFGVEQDEIDACKNKGELLKFLDQLKEEFEAEDAPSFNAEDDVL